jgi:hypothetical protein
VRPRRTGDSDLRPVPILAALNRQRVRYVVMGSTAAIIQDIDLALTDLDIVPAVNADNLVRLVRALRELDAREKGAEQVEDAEQALADPSVLLDATFWTFVTAYGDLDLVLRPAGFEAGFSALIDNVHVVALSDDRDPSLTVEVIVADVRVVYESKRRAGRPKDIEVLPRFAGIHLEDPKASVRARDRKDRHDKSASTRRDE